MTNIFTILESVMLSKVRYIEVLTQDNESIFKIKLLVDDNDMVNFLDSFFDNGFKVVQISKEDFDNFEGLETIKINF